MLVRESRPDKLIEISTPEVRKRQRDRLTKEDARTLAELRRAERPSLPTHLESAAHSLHYAIEHIFERISVAPDYEVLAEALRHGRGKVHYEELKGALALQESDETILRQGTDITTAETLERERNMIAVINEGADALGRLGGADRFAPSDHLNPEQKQAVEPRLDSQLVIGPPVTIDRRRRDDFIQSVLLDSECAVPFKLLRNAVEPERRENGV